MAKVSNNCDSLCGSLGAYRRKGWSVYTSAILLQVNSVLDNSYCVVEVI